MGRFRMESTRSGTLNLSYREKVWWLGTHQGIGAIGQGLIDCRYRSGSRMVPTIAMNPNVGAAQFGARGP